MPLVRKPAGSTPPAVAPTQDLASGLASPGEDARWMAARDAAGVQGCADMLAAALRVETSPRVREALFMSLARTGDAPSVDALQSLLRSDAAHLRTGALDALRLVVAAVPAILSPMLRDHDADIRILSCELARTLPAGVATAHLNALLRDETEPNVCAAAIDVLAEVGDGDALPALAECAARFQATPFLSFAARVAAERIRARVPPTRA